MASLTPDEVAQSSALMIAAMNIEDQSELLGGMRAGAPPEVFTGVLVLAESVLEPSRYAALVQRLEA